MAGSLVLVSLSLLALASFLEAIPGRGRRQSIDEIFRQAVENSPWAARSRGRGHGLMRESRDSKAVIVELDIASPIPEEGETKAVIEIPTRPPRGTSPTTRPPTALPITAGPTTAKPPTRWTPRGGTPRGGSRGGPRGAPPRAGPRGAPPRRGSPRGAPPRGGRKPPARQPPRARGGRRSRQKRNAMTSTTRFWPNKQVHYMFDFSLSSTEQSVFQQAIAEYNKYTCIDWIPRTTQSKYVKIIRGGGCWSYIGHNYWSQPQEMSLDNGCLNSKKTPMHEMMHALGVYHEHTRPDQAQYVQINFANIRSGSESNFVAKDASAVNLYGTVYSYESIMHYGSTYFSSNGQPTITVLDPSKENVIGRSPTFSFEDIELLTKMYSCNENCAPAKCPPGAFQGHDCNCYCKTGIDTDPVKNCGEVCIEPEQACACSSRTGACSGLSHSTCQSSSQACECDSGYVKHNGVCTLTTSITCDELSVDCKCSRNSGACSAGVPNSECDRSSDSCRCQQGFSEDSNGACTNINSVSCNSPGVPCFCTSKGASACSGVSNSFCDSETDSCECVEDFYQNGNVCAAAPACTGLNQACQCFAQGEDACDFTPHSVCDSTTNKCGCDPSSHTENNGVCVSAHLFVSDGSSVHPFMHSAISTVNFAPMEGSDASSFEVDSNGWHLYASGTGTGQQAAIETEMLVVPGRWCVDYSAKLSNARIYTEYSYNGARWGYSYLYTSGTMGYFYKRSYSQSTNSQIKFRIRGTPHNNGPWSVAIDPVKVYKC